MEDLSRDVGSLSSPEAASKVLEVVLAAAENRSHFWLSADGRYPRPTRLRFARPLSTGIAFFIRCSLRSFESWPFFMAPWTSKVGCSAAVEAPRLTTSEVRANLFGADDAASFDVAIGLKRSASCNVARSASSSPSPGSSGRSSNSEPSSRSTGPNPCLHSRELSLPNGGAAIRGAVARARPEGPRRANRAPRPRGSRATCSPR